MDLLHAMRDLGVADPAADTAGEDAARAALLREIERTTATAAPLTTGRRRRPRARLRIAIPACAVAAGGVAAVVIVTGAAGADGGAHPSVRDLRAPAVIHGQDTADIIRRARAQLDGVGQGKVDVWVQAGGNGNPGSDSTSTTRSYTDPASGTFHQSSVLASPDGTEIYAQYIVGTPVSGGMRFETTAIDPQQHLYAVSSNVGSAYGSTSGDARQIRQQLADGQATDDGTATIDGQRTIKLTLPTSRGYSTILYVNARTDAPVRSVSASPAGAQTPSDTANLDTEDWQVADPGDVARTELDEIPAGFTQVSVDALHQANTAAR